MPQVHANGVNLEYESFGPEGADLVLLIMGAGGQLTAWPVELCEELVRRGYRVVRYDNRDAGLSTSFEAAGQPDWLTITARLQAGLPLTEAYAGIPYTLDDMVADAVGLIDALNVRRAHVVGASLGGMIAQLLAADHPDRVLSATLIMTNSGNPDLMIQLPPATPPAQQTPEGFVEERVQLFKWLSSPAYPRTEDQIREEVRRDQARAFVVGGADRQIAAVGAVGDRRARIARIKAPTVVLQGAADPGVTVAMAEDLAKSIPGAELRVIPGMGHDFPTGLVTVFADAITSAARRAER